MDIVCPLQPLLKCTWCVPGTLKGAQNGWGFLFVGKIFGYETQMQYNAIFIKIQISFLDITSEVHYKL